MILQQNGGAAAIFANRTKKGHRCGKGYEGEITGLPAFLHSCFLCTSIRPVIAADNRLTSNAAVQHAYAVIPFVSAMNAVSRLISSSLKIVSLMPAWINRVGRSL